MNGEIIHVTSAEGLKHYKELLDKLCKDEIKNAPQRSQKVEDHWALCREINELYARKNADYGDSFHASFMEEGMAMPRIRLSDKLNRFKKLSYDPYSALVKEESIRDTLIDLANYAIMTILEMDAMKGEAKEDEN